MRGSVIHRRGLAKKKGGVGRHITKMVPRIFAPNLQHQRIWVPELKKFVRVRVTARGLKTINKQGAYKALKKRRHLNRKGSLSARTLRDYCRCPTNSIDAADSSQIEDSSRDCHGASLDYEGSLTVSADLAELVGLIPYEKILVSNLRNGERFETYAIYGRRDRIIELNGATAHLGKIGDR